MKFDKNIEDFIRLRVEGKSFDAIAKELKVSKNTLLEWNKRFQVREAIGNEKILKINCLIKTFEMDRESRLKSYLGFSKKINDELLNRDLSQIPTEKLLSMAITNEERIFSIKTSTMQFGINKSFVIAGEQEDGFFRFSLDD